MAKDINFKTSPKDLLSSQELFFDASSSMDDVLFYIKKQLSISNNPDINELKDKAALPQSRAFTTKILKVKVRHNQ